MPDFLSNLIFNFFEIAAYYLELAKESPAVFAVQFFLDGGWLIFIPLTIWGGILLYLEYKQNKTAAGIKYVYLAIDVPQLNEQATKAVEQIFAQMAGTLKGIGFWDKFFFGDIQEPFSLELVSIGGYIQYIIRTPIFYRDLVESAIYAQYPDAEVTEVEDYTRNVELVFPSDIYDLWGTELILEKSSCYPIRTHEQFEYGLTQSFIDPMAALLEILSKISENEQVWLQLVIKPIGGSWQKDCERVVKKLIGAKITPEKSALGKLFSPIGSVVGGLFEIFQHGYGIDPATGGDATKKDVPSLMQYLSPGEQEVVKAIQNKYTKIGYKVKFRMIYFGTRETFEKGRGVAAVIGALAQYNTLHLNSFKTAKKTKTKAQYFLVKKRLTTKQRKILRAYQQRSMQQGQGTGFIMNIEELASIYHFPTINVKAQLVKYTETKKAGPPVSLPVERRFKLPQPVSNNAETVEVEDGLERIEQSDELVPDETLTIMPSNLYSSLSTEENVPDNEEKKDNLETKNEPPDNLPI